MIALHHRCPAPCSEYHQPTWMMASLWNALLFSRNSSGSVEWVWSWQYTVSTSVLHHMRNKLCRPSHKPPLSKPLHHPYHFFSLLLWVPWLLVSIFTYALQVADSRSTCSQAGGFCTHGYSSHRQAFGIFSYMSGYVNTLLKKHYKSS